MLYFAFLSFMIIVLSRYSSSCYRGSDHWTRWFSVCKGNLCIGYTSTGEISIRTTQSAFSDTYISSKYRHRRFRWILPMFYFSDSYFVTCRASLCYSCRSYLLGYLKNAASGLMVTFHQCKYSSTHNQITNGYSKCRWWFNAGHCKYLLIASNLRCLWQETPLTLLYHMR